MIPVLLFVFKRVNTLKITLASLRRNNVRKLIVFSDAPRNDADIDGVAAVRQLISEIDWCDVEVHCREVNAGLGKSIREGVSLALEKYEAVIVSEDDLEFVEGAIDYLSAALCHYASDTRVMSVTGWTNQHIIPSDVIRDPYFDGRAECLLWGTWRRVWKDMDQLTALEMMDKISKAGDDPYRWGGDLPFMAKTELISNIWAVRFCFLHILKGGLCMRPPWSMVNHIGWGNDATNASGKNWEDNGCLAAAPKIPEFWPEPVLNGQCEVLHRKMYKRPWSDVFPRLVPVIRKLLSRLGKKV